jgi:hypothetical protein
VLRRREVLGRRPPLIGVPFGFVRVPAQPNDTPPRCWDTPFLPEATRQLNVRFCDLPDCPCAILTWRLPGFVG